MFYCRAQGYNHNASVQEPTTSHATSSHEVNLPVAVLLLFSEVSSLLASKVHFVALFTFPDAVTKLNQEFY